MIRVRNTAPQFAPLFENGQLQMAAWEAYMETVYPGLGEILREDLQSYLDAGYSYERDILPSIALASQPGELAQLEEQFLRLTEGLDARIEACTGKRLDVDITLYLGLNNSAGWVTSFAGRDCVLLGAEKILSLGWQTPRRLAGLIYHELGHVYQAQHGVLERDEAGEGLLWQLFCEGIAMHFEQLLVGDPDFFHQDENGWKAWCDRHLAQIARDFEAERHITEPQKQRFFGDLCDYHGHGDVGYYLGARWISALTKTHPLEEIVCMDVPEARRYYIEFLQSFL